MRQASQSADASYGHAAGAVAGTRRSTGSLDLGAKRGRQRSAVLASRGKVPACLPTEPCRERSEVFGVACEAVHATERAPDQVGSQAPVRRTSAVACSVAPGAQERAPLAEHKTRLLDGRVNQPDRLKAGLRTTGEPEARRPIGGSEATVQPRSAATRFRAGNSRALGTFDKPTTPEIANSFRPPRTVSRAREGSVRAPTWTS